MERRFQAPARTEQVWSVRPFVTQLLTEAQVSIMRKDCLSHRQYNVHRSGTMHGLSRIFASHAGFDGVQENLTAYT